MQLACPHSTGDNMILVMEIPVIQMNIEKDHSINSHAKDDNGTVPIAMAVIVI